MQVINLIKLLAKKKWIVVSIVLLGSISLLVLLLPKFQLQKQTTPSYSNQKNPYFFSVKIIENSSRGIPCINLVIENKQVPVKIDLGFSGGVVLPSEVLNEVPNRSFFHSTIFQSFRGKTYKSDIYEIPSLKIGGLTFHEIKVEEVNLEFENDAIVSSGNELALENIGRIGWKLFQKLNVFLDIPNSKLAFCDGLESLKKQGYLIEKFVESPLFLDRNVIEFEVLTNSGPLRCMLDTGSTFNLLNKDLESGKNDHMVIRTGDVEEFQEMNPENKDMMIFNPEEIYESADFRIGGRDFGSVKFKKIKSPLGIEAVIGMEFLESTLVFIDFSESKIYFYKPD